MELIGLYLIAAGLLVAAGLGKAIRPDDTARALAPLLPGSRARPPAQSLVRSVLRAAALAETALGVVALALPRPATAALVALSYLAFAGVVAYAHRRGGPLSTCGCFGRPDTPPTVVHLLLNLALAAAAATFAVAAPHHGSLVTQLAHQPWDGLPLVFASGVGLWLTFLALSPLAVLAGARRLVQPRGSAVGTAS